MNFLGTIYFESVSYGPKINKTEKESLLLYEWTVTLYIEKSICDYIDYTGQENINWTFLNRKSVDGAKRRVKGAFGFLVEANHVGCWKNFREMPSKIVNEFPRLKSNSDVYVGLPHTLRGFVALN